MNVIGSNLKSLNALNALRLNSRSLTESIKQLSTGRRVNSAIDDAVSSSISTLLTKQIRGLIMASRNLNDAISFAQTGEAALNKISNMMQRMRELAVQASSATIEINQRSYLNNEFIQLQTQIDKVVKDTKFNGINILENKAHTTTAPLNQPMMMSIQSFSVPPNITNEVTNIQISHDSGYSNSDFITNIQSQTITANLANDLQLGEILEGSVDGGLNWDDITDTVDQYNKISWSKNINDNQNQIVFRITNGTDELVLANTQNYTLDRIIPNAIANITNLSHDSGISSIDFITNVETQTITGTLSQTLNDGEKLLISLDGSEPSIDITNHVNGTSFNYVANLLDGTNTIRTKILDLAGNIGASSTKVYTVDKNSPSTTGSIISLSNDTGISNTDFNTNTSLQTITGSISNALNEGEYLLASVDGSTPSINITGSVNNNSIEWTTNLISGSNLIRMKVVDTAGNGIEFNKNYTLDNIAPTSPIVSEIGSNDISDGRMNQSESISTNFRVSFTTTGISPVQIGDIVELKMNGNSFSSIKIKTINSSDLSNKFIDFNLLASDLGPDGTKSLRATITDTYGNTVTSAARTFTLDTAPPVVPSSPILSSINTIYTKNNKISISNIETGAVLQYQINNGSWINASNNEVVLPNDGTYNAGTIAVRQRDLAGNTSPILMNSQNIILDRVIANPILQLATDTNISGDNYTKSTIVNVLNIENGATWEYKINNGTWQNGNPDNSIILSTDGSYDINVRQTDRALNTSNISSISNVIIDNSSPTKPSLTLLNDEGDSSLSISDSGLMKVTLESGATFMYNINDTGWNQGVVSAGSGSFSLKPGRYLPNSIKIKQIDLAGNESEVYSYPKETLINLGFNILSSDQSINYITIGSVNLDGAYKDANIIDTINSNQSILALDSALRLINRARSKFASSVQSLTSKTDVINIQVSNLSQSRSIITDTDYAQSMAEMVKNEILRDISMAVLSQSNQEQKMVMQLLAQQS